MTPAKLAKDECSSYHGNGDCSFYGNPKRCRVLCGEKCAFFEDYVLPLADKPSPTKEPWLQKERREARDSYHNLHRQLEFNTDS